MKSKRVVEETVKVRYRGGDYHRSKDGVDISLALFNTYIRVRRWLDELRTEIQIQVNPPKDKPMHLSKYHVTEGETHHFSEDGSVSIANE